jgi:hypothetical protein
LPARRKGDLFYFRAFGEDCCLGPHGISFSGIPETGPKGLLISLYATHILPSSIRLEPYKSFKDLPNSMPYWGAFITNSEQVLTPYVDNIYKNIKSIMDLFGGETAPSSLSGDFSLVLYPLPKIALCYIFYLADEDFPSSCTCLFSYNAIEFMPLDGLADVGEYTAKRIIELI